MENNCRSCGGILERIGNYNVCKHCGNKWIIDIADDVHAVDRANAWAALRAADFEKATELFEEIIIKEPKNPEARWGCALSKASIVYVNDVMENKKVPTCHNITEKSFVENKDVVKAIELADGELAETYRKQAAQIEKIRVEWLKKASNEPAYDVFICFKDSDRENGIERTQDSIDAQELYNNLRDDGFKVFFSRVSLKDKISEQYEPYIYHAIKTAKVMIVFGSKPEYFNAVWVKNEWMRFNARISNGEKHKNGLVVVCNNMDPSDLPKALKGRQCLKYTDKTFFHQLVLHINKVIEESKEEKHVTKKEIKGGQISKKAGKLHTSTLTTHDVGKGVKADTSLSEKQSLSVVQSFVKEKQWKEAEKYLKNILFDNPSFAEALWTQLLISHKAVNNEALLTNIDKFNKNDWLIVENTINAAGQDYAGEILDYLYQSYRKITPETYLSVLGVVLSYQYDRRQKRIDEAIMMSIEKSNMALFEILLEALESHQVDDYIQYNFLYLEKTRDKQEKNKCADRILEVEEGNLQALQYKFNAAYEDSQDVDFIVQSFEKWIKYTLDVRGWVSSVIDDVANSVTTPTQVAFSRELITYYPGELKEIYHNLLNLANRLVSLAFFEDAKYFFGLLLNVNQNDARLFWGICLAKIQAKNEADIINSARLLSDVPEYIKYLGIVSEERRRECMKLAKKQENLKKRTIRKIIIVAASALSLIALVSSVLLSAFVFIPNSKYDAALELMLSEKYVEAIEAFEALDGYKDSEEKIVVCETAMKEKSYYNAVRLMVEGQYSAAIDIFRNLEGYKDSEKRMAACETAINEMTYGGALELIDLGEYEEALSLFKTINTYKDSADKIEYCEKKLAEIKFGEYKTKRESIFKNTVQYNGHRYMLIEGTFTWEQAKLICEGLGGHLATITSQAEDNICYQLFNVSNSNYCWLGANDLNSEGNWQWITGEAWSFSNWGGDEPNGGTRENYLSYWGDQTTGHWYDCIPNDIIMTSLICEWERSDLDSVSSQYGFIDSTNSVYNDAFYFNGSMYKIIESDMTSEEANRYCKELGGHLATITSKEEDRAVFSYIMKEGRLDCMLGGTDEVTEGIWTWRNGESFSYSNWHDGEPNDSNGEDYLHYSDSANGQWNDIAWQKCFLCEWDNCSVIPAED